MKTKKFKVKMVIETAFVYDVEAKTDKEALMLVRDDMVHDRLLQRSQMVTELKIVK